MARLAPAYTPRRPTESVLYRIVREHLETFLHWARDEYEKPLPRYVENELRAYLRARAEEITRMASPAGPDRGEGDR